MPSNTNLSARSNWSRPNLTTSFRRSITSTTRVLPSRRLCKCFTPGWRNRYFLRTKPSYLLNLTNMVPGSSPQSPFTASLSGTCFSKKEKKPRPARKTVTKNLPPAGYCSGHSPSVRDGAADTRSRVRFRVSQTLCKNVRRLCCRNR